MEKLIKEVAQTHAINYESLQKAAKHGQIPARRVGGIWLVDDTSEQFTSWLARYRQHVAAMQSPSEETTRRQQYHRKYYEEVTKPRRQGKLSVFNEFPETPNIDREKY